MPTIPLYDRPAITTIRMDKTPETAMTGASHETHERVDKSPENFVAGPSYETRERMEKFPENFMAGVSFETREGMGKGPENTTSGASYTARDSISGSDHIELYTGNSRDPLPLPSPADVAFAEDRDRVYPPTGQVILIMASLLVSMFLVALVSLAAVLNCCSRMITLSRTE